MQMKINGCCPYVSVCVCVCVCVYIAALYTTIYICVCVCVRVQGFDSVLLLRIHDIYKWLSSVYDSHAVILCATHEALYIWHSHPIHYKPHV